MQWWIALTLVTALVAAGMYAGMMFVVCLFVAIRELWIGRKRS